VRSCTTNERRPSPSEQAWRESVSGAFRALCFASSPALPGPSLPSNPVRWGTAVEELSDEDGRTPDLRKKLLSSFLTPGWEPSPSLKPARASQDGAGRHFT